MCTLTDQDFIFIDQAQIVDTPTITRSSDAYYKEANKTLIDVGPNDLRFRYNDDGEFTGLLIEPDPATSLITESEDFSDPDLWHNDAGITLGVATTGPDGNVGSATAITGDVGGGTMEYWATPSTEIGGTDFTMATGGQSAMAAIEMLPDSYGDPLPYVVSSHGVVDADAGAGNTFLPTWGTYTYSANDIAIVFTESQAGTVSFGGSAPPTQFITTLDAGDTQLNVGWRRMTGTEGSDRAIVVGTGTDHRMASIIFIRGCRTTGNPFGDVVTSTDSTSGATKTIAGFEGDERGSLALLLATYSNDLAVNAASGLTNSNIESLTTLINGEGSVLGNGGGMFAFAGDYDAGPDAGIIRSDSGATGRSSVFLRHVYGSSDVRLYNSQDPATYSDFDIVNGTVTSGDGEIEEYVNGWYRVSLFVDDDTADYEFGFGLEVEGDFEMFGANLTEGDFYWQYVLDDNPMTGDTLTEKSGANLVYSNIPEPSPYDAGPNGDAVIWEAGTYNLGDRVIEDHFLYEVAATPSTTDQPSVGVNAEPATWFAVSPSNQRKMFSVLYDGIAYGVDTATIGNDGAVEVGIQSTALIDSISAHGVEAQRMIIRLYVDDVIEQEEIIQLVSYEGMDDYYDFFMREPIYVSQSFKTALKWNPLGVITVRFENDSNDPVTVGKLVLGQGITIGSTAAGVEIDGRDFSRTNRNSFGQYTVSQGRTIDIKRFKIAVEPSKVAFLNEKIKEQGVLPTGWIGNENLEPTIIYGYPTRRGFVYNTYFSTGELGIEEV